MLNFLIQFSASITTLAGMYLGSTTKLGVSFYLLSTVFWWWMMFRQRMWGMVPLNVGGLLVNLVNLCRAFW